MPKLVLPVEGENSSSSDQYDQHNRAVDSNKAIVVAYYVRKLMTKSIQALETYKEEQNAKEFLKQAVTQNYKKMLLRLHFKQLQKYSKLHRGHFRAKLMASAFLRKKLGNTYLTLWKNRTQ